MHVMCWPPDAPHGRRGSDPSMHLSTAHQRANTTPHGEPDGLHEQKSCVPHDRLSGMPLKGPAANSRKLADVSTTPLGIDRSTTFVSAGVGGSMFLAGARHQMLLHAPRAIEQAAGLTHPEQSDGTGGALFRPALPAHARRTAHPDLSGVLLTNLQAQCAM